MSYQFYEITVVVSLNRFADDGSFGEGDNADADGSVENVLTGFADDRVQGNDVSNYIDSGYGNDFVNVDDNAPGAIDIVACGLGFDSVTIDIFDSVDRDGESRCENVPTPAVTRVTPTMTMRISPRRDATLPHRFRVSGTVNPGIVPPAFGCTGRDFV